MRHFPIFLELTAKKVVVSGAGECAVAKLRLILKSDADIFVYGDKPTAQIQRWALEQKITYVARELNRDDVADTVLLYAANENAKLDAQAAEFARAAGAIVNIVDNLNDSDFITPAIVDRSPVTVAIGTEGAAPVLARMGQSFRDRASVLPMGRKRREFWSEYYFKKGPAALASGGRGAVQILLTRLLDDTIAKQDQIGQVHFMGSGNGDPELLTLKARNILHEADVIIHDVSVPNEILELVRREAILHTTSPLAGHKSLSKIAKNHTTQGEQVVRLVYGDLAQSKAVRREITELSAIQVPFEIINGVPVEPAVQVFDQHSLRRNMPHSGIFAKQSQNTHINEMVGL